jgi:nucleotide-binding universal stress UspA family protein
VDDVSAWVMLAFVVAIARATGAAAAAWTALFSALYVAAMFLLVRPFLHRLQLVYERQGRLSQTVVAVIFLAVLASAATTEWIGIHAMFGAFLMGFIMPKGTQFVRHLGEKLEDFTVVLLLPIFFAYAGLRTRLGLLNDPGLWVQAALVIGVACLGKFGSGAVAARLTGMGWRESAALGILMNTRGLVELVILTVGLQLGVISETVFTIMVIMALFTTFITTPLLHWVYPSRLLSPVADAGAGAEAEAPDGAFRVLIPVADPRSGGPLLRVAELLTGPATAAPGRMIYALHLARPVEHDAYRAAVAVRDGAARDAAAEAEADASLRPLLTYAQAHGVPVEPISFVTRDAAADIARVARARRVHLVLMGFHKPVFGRTILGGTVHRVMTGVEADVAVFVDRGFPGARRLLVPFLGGPHDRLALRLAARFARHAASSVTMLHVVPPGRGEKSASASARDGLGAEEAVRRIFDDPSTSRPVELRVVEDASPVDAVLRVAAEFDLVVVGVGDEWGLESHLFGMRPERIAEASPTSLLLVRAHVDRPLPPAPSGAAGTDRHDAAESDSAPTPSVGIPS